MQGSLTNFLGLVLYILIRNTLMLFYFYVQKTPED